MMQLNYSNLNEKLDENEEEIKKESEMFSSKVERKYDDEIKEKMGVQYEDHLEEVFDRENYLQMVAARQYMKKHFKRGKDPPPLYFEKGVVTSVNMYSEKSKESEAEKKTRALEEAMERRVQQNMTDIKRENSLLVHQLTELKRQIEEMKELLNDQKVKIHYFEDLNVDEVKKMKSDYINMEATLNETRENIKEIEKQRQNLKAESLAKDKFIKELREDAQLSLTVDKEQLDKIKILCD